MSSWLSSRGVVSAAIVGIVGAAGLFIYEQLYAEKRRAMLAKEVGRLDSQVATMKEELQALRDLQKQSSQARKQRPRRPRVRPAAAPTAAPDVVDGAASLSYASDSEYLTDYASIVGTDGEMDSDEFYDVHSDSDSELDNNSRRKSSNDTSPEKTKDIQPNGKSLT